MNWGVCLALAGVLAGACARAKLMQSMHAHLGRWPAV